MIFRPELAQLIVNGRKTETRRPIKTEHCRYEPGKHYAVQPGRGQKAIDRILVRTVHRETLGDLDHQAALREGFPGFGEFLSYWADLYNIDIGKLNPEQPLWVIRFELYRPEPTVIHRKDRVRLLAIQHGRKDAGQYTTSTFGALNSEPEAIDPRIIGNLPSTMHANQQWIKDRAWFQAAEVEGATLGERLDRLLAESKRRHIDISGPLKEIERQTARATKRLDNAA